MSRIVRIMIEDFVTTLSQYFILLRTNIGFRNLRYRLCAVLIDLDGLRKESNKFYNQLYPINTFLQPYNSIFEMIYA